MKPPVKYAAIGLAFVALIAWVVLESTYKPVDSSATQKALSAAEQAMKPREKPQPDEGTEFDAYVVAQGFVRDRLKAPATAQFPAQSQTRITKDHGMKWIVSGYVDSQNSFGALLRIRYRAEMTYRGKGNYYLDDLKFYE